MTTEKLPTDSTIAVVGLGYVGLPLCLAYAEGGYRVLGVDIDQFKTDKINAGESYIKHIGGDQIKEYAGSGLLTATTAFSQINNADAIILCVPTPLDEHFEPDLTYVVKTIESIVPHLKSGQIVSLESTTYPGTTEEELVSRVEAAGLTVGKDIFIVYSPEREDPGNPEFSATNIPKVIGGHTEACSAKGQQLYGAVFHETVPVSSTRVAELTKLLENIYRAVNIGLVNELKIVAQRMDIDIWEVIQAASSKPFGFKPFYPGPGLGGHCIPIDPFYLTWKAREYGVHTRFIELAGEINRNMPQYVIDSCMRALNTQQKAINGSKVLVMGLSYKPNVDDDRESPSYELLDLLQELGAEPDYFDPYVPSIPKTREHLHWAGKKSIQWNQETVSSYDLILISTWHDCSNADELTDWAQLVVDTRNAVDPNNSKVHTA